MKYQSVIPVLLSVSCHYNGFIDKICLFLIVRVTSLEKMFLTCSVSTDSGKSSASDQDKISKNDLEKSIEESASFLRKTLPYEPEIGIICGSGLGFLADELEEPFKLPYSTIPNFPTCTVKGHKGKLILGKIANLPVLCMQGRLHFYEGHPVWKCTLPIRIMKSLNIQVLIVSNAAGGINKLYKSGDVMIIEDHIDLVRLLGSFSMMGPPGDLFDFNYDPKERIYDKELIEIGLKIGEQLLTKQRVHRGVYIFSSGPSYESTADLKFLQRFGSDVVGSSTVHEAIVAKSCGMKVFGFSLVTAECSVDCEGDEDEICHEEVLKIGSEYRDVLKKFLEHMIDNIRVSKS